LCDHLRRFIGPRCIGWNRHLDPFAPPVMVARRPRSGVGCPHVVLELGGAGRLAGQRQQDLGILLVAADAPTRCRDNQVDQPIPIGDSEMRLGRPDISNPTTIRALPTLANCPPGSGLPPACHKPTRAISPSEFGADPDRKLRAYAQHFPLSDAIVEPYHHHARDGTLIAYKLSIKFQLSQCDFAFHYGET
jgi:hypothetical protein